MHLTASSCNESTETVPLEIFLNQNLNNFLSFKNYFHENKKLFPKILHKSFIFSVPVCFKLNKKMCVHINLYLYIDRSRYIILTHYSGHKLRNSSWVMFRHLKFYMEVQVIFQI